MDNDPYTGKVFNGKVSRLFSAKKRILLILISIEIEFKETHATEGGCKSISVEDTQHLCAVHSSKLQAVTDCKGFPSK